MAETESDVPLRTECSNPSTSISLDPDVLLNKSKTMVAIDDNKTFQTEDMSLVMDVVKEQVKRTFVRVERNRQNRDQFRYVTKDVQEQFLKGILSSSPQVKERLGKVSLVKGFIPKEIDHLSVVHSSDSKSSTKNKKKARKRKNKNKKIRIFDEFKEKVEQKQEKIVKYGPTLNQPPSAPKSKNLSLPMQTPSINLASKLKTTKPAVVSIKNVQFQDITESSYYSPSFVDNKQYDGKQISNKEPEYEYSTSLVLSVPEDLVDILNDYLGDLDKRPKSLVSPRKKQLSPSSPVQLRSLYYTPRSPMLNEISEESVVEEEIELPDMKKKEETELVLIPTQAIKAHPTSVDVLSNASVRSADYLPRPSTIEDESDSFHPSPKSVQFTKFYSTVPDSNVDKQIPISTEKEEIVQRSSIISENDGEELEHRESIYFHVTPEESEIILNSISPEIPKHSSNLSQIVMDVEEKSVSKFMIDVGSEIEQVKQQEEPEEMKTIKSEEQRPDLIKESTFLLELEPKSKQNLLTPKFISTPPHKRSPENLLKSDYKTGLLIVEPKSNEIHMKTLRSPVEELRQSENIEEVKSGRQTPMQIQKATKSVQTKSTLRTSLERKSAQKPIKSLTFGQKGPTPLISIRKSNNLFNQSNKSIENGEQSSPEKDKTSQHYYYRFPDDQSKLMLMNEKEAEKPPKANMMMEFEPKTVKIRTKSREHLTFESMDLNVNTASNVSEAKTIERSPRTQINEMNELFSTKPKTTMKTFGQLKLENEAVTPRPNSIEQITDKCQSIQTFQQQQPKNVKILSEILVKQYIPKSAETKVEQGTLIKKRTSVLEPLTFSEKEISDDSDDENKSGRRSKTESQSFHRKIVDFYVHEDHFTSSSEDIIDEDQIHVPEQISFDPPTIQNADLYDRKELISRMEHLKQRQRIHLGNLSKFRQRFDYLKSKINDNDRKKAINEQHEEEDWNLASHPGQTTTMATINIKLALVLASMLMILVAIKYFILPTVVHHIMK